jgi:integrase
VLAEQYQTGLIKRNLKPASVNKNISILKAMFAKAVEWGLVEEETLKQVRKVKQLQENNRRLRYLSKEECQKLLAECKERKEHLKPLIITALNTGMRRGEILSLKWENVDLRHGFILLEITKNGERREIPINATLRNVLEGVALNNLDGSKHVFHDKEGKPYQGVKTSFKTACTDAKITNFHFHDLRHTFASHLVMAGVDITTVKELLGHKTLTMTLRYAHLAPTHKVKALAVLDNTINFKPTAQKPHTAKEKGLQETCNPLKVMVGDAGFEPATPAV